MRALTFAVVVFSVFVSDSEAQNRQFPYEAIVVEDGVYIRSGGGEKYYPTGRMAKGQRVQVNRHDPGGWYQITPPEGSFSWVPKQYVNQIRPGVGEIKELGVVAWVGTDFGREADVWQRRFSKNEQVQIIGEGQIEHDKDRGPEAMYKIKSPRKEYRWIPGQAVIPADEARRFLKNPLDANPSNRTPNRNEQFLSSRPKPRSSSPSTNRNPVSRGNAQASRQQPTYDRARMAADQAKLQELDNLFRSIIRQPIAQWNFAQLESGYMNLKQNASHPSIANKVDMRLPALKRELKRKRRYDDFATLASATAQRDRQLAQMASGTTGAAPPATEILPAPPRGTPSVYSASMPGGTEPPMNGPGLRVPPALPEPSPTPPPGNVPRPPEPAPAGNGNGGQSFPAPRMAGTVPIVPEQKQPIAGNPNRKAGPASPVFDPRQQPVEVDREPVPPGMTRVPRRHPKYVGAGIIMRSTELDVPKYVLLAPTGKILAYLEAVGSFDLERHVNFAMGVKGDRFNNPKWNADLIKVRDLETISLKQ